MHLRWRCPLIRPSVRTGAPSPLWGEGFGAVQIGRDSSFCGTFGYIYWELGRSAPVGGGRPSVPPLRRRRGKPGRRVREAAPYKRGGGGKPPPYGFPETVLKLGRGTPWCSLRRHAPGRQRAGEGTRPYGVFTNGSTYRKRDRSGTCPLKHRGETQFRRKFLCFLSFSKKGSYTGPWRKRSIISWVREIAEPPWGRFSRSNQVPSPSSSS